MSEDLLCEIALKNEIIERKDTQIDELIGINMALTTRVALKDEMIEALESIIEVQKKMISEAHLDA